jgi:hypothetical protein
VGDLESAKAPPIQLLVDPQVPAFPPDCFDKYGELKRKCMNRG